MLSDQIKATFKDAARKLTGPKKREFTAQVALDYFDGLLEKQKPSWVGIVEVFNVG